MDQSSYLPDPVYQKNKPVGGWVHMRWPLAKRDIYSTLKMFCCVVYSAEIDQHGGRKNTHLAHTKAGFALLP